MALKDTLDMISRFQQMDVQQQQLAMQEQKFQASQATAQAEQARQQQLDEAMQRGTQATNQQVVGGPGVFDPSNPADLATIMQEEPNYANLLLQNQGIQALQTPGGTAAGLQLLDAGTGDSSGDRSVFGQQLRGLGTDLLFLSQTYGGGKVPRNADELEEMTVAASQDPLYGEKRQDWANDKTSGRLKVEGVAADDPNQIIISDSKRGRQYRAASGGDALNQLLANAGTEETGSLAVYRNLYDVSNELEGLYDEALVGVFDGNVENLASKFVDRPEFVKFKSTADRLRTIVYGFSGKQINETELVWLDGILPKMYNPDGNWLERLDSIKNWVADKQEAQLIEMRNARRFTGTKSLREETPGVSEERLKQFQKKLNTSLGEPGADTTPEPKRIRIKIGG